MEYSSQFRQPAFRGYGDQAMRSHRVTPAPQPAPSAQPTPRAQGHQLSLVSADEARNPQGPPAPTFNADQFRAAQHALPGMSTRSMASQRVTPAPQPAAPAPAASRSTWTQPELTMLGPTPAMPSSPSAAGPSPTRWPSPAPAASPGPAAPTPARPPVTINRAAYTAAGRRFGPAPNPSQPSPAATRPSPPAPAQPPTPPAAPAARPQMPAWVGRAGRIGGLAVGLGAKAFESANKPAVDPARSGSPLYKTSQGWNKS